jgi:hypothetical protein
MKFQRIALFCLAAGLLAAAFPSQARVTRIQIEKTEPSADGNGHEVLRGRAFGALDPAAAVNAVITDIQFAPRNSQGLVEYVTTFSLTKPVDMTQASGLLWYELVNRGGPLRTFDSMAPHGHVTLMNGWQADIAPSADNYTVQAPVARNADGSPITGMVLARLADARPAPRRGRWPCWPTPSLTTPPRWTPRRPASSPSVREAQRRKQRRRTIPPGEWAFADCRSAPFPGNPHPRMICVKGGFDPSCCTK